VGFGRNHRSRLRNLGARRSISPSTSSAMTTSGFRHRARNGRNLPIAVLNYPDALTKASLDLPEVRAKLPGEPARPSSDTRKKKSAILGGERLD
jgi:hypothetical protein